MCANPTIPAHIGGRRFARARPARGLREACTPPETGRAGASPRFDNDWCTAPRGAVGALGAGPRLVACHG
ncbi:hypothetical protein GCM10009740_06010 [Terrabacter terrae]|uniref:Uncharacterized protein n=1 Tax=Terrabacter terrae TaxID=318434 RepID=A0ABN2TT59_9MICO